MNTRLPAYFPDAEVAYAAGGIVALGFTVKQLVELALPWHCVIFRRA